jgi:ABC-type glycerol-3-phosphate transport system substrate-binding protein
MYAKKGDGALGRWANGECPIALGPSTAMAAVGPIESSKLGVAPMPLWEEVSTQQGGLFPDGDGLYLTTQSNPELKKAAQKFGAWWLTPVVAAEWHQKSGSVPFTEAAYLATKRGGFYTNVPGWESLSARLAAPTTKMVTPLYIADRKRVLALIEADLEKAFAAGKASKAALDDAVRSANAFSAGARGGAASMDVPPITSKNVTQAKKL